MDYRLERWINHPAGHHPTTDAILRHAATWPEQGFILVIVVWFFVGWAGGLPRDRRGAITAAIAAGMALLVNQGIILLWQRDRPFVAHPSGVHVLLSHRADPSFPSDHASPAFATAVVLFLVHRRLGILALVVALVMVYARVYCGDHYPADVIAGALVGAGLAWVLSKYLNGAMAALQRLVDRVILTLHLPLPNHGHG